MIVVAKSSHVTSRHVRTDDTTKMLKCLASYYTSYFAKKRKKPTNRDTYLASNYSKLLLLTAAFIKARLNAFS